jgi:hypothetical protein
VSVSCDSLSLIRLGARVLLSFSLSLSRSLARSLSARESTCGVFDIIFECSKHQLHHHSIPLSLSLSVCLSLSLTHTHTQTHTHINAASTPFTLSLSPRF